MTRMAGQLEGKAGITERKKSAYFGLSLDSNYAELRNKLALNTGHCI